MSETTQEDRDAFRVALNTNFSLPLAATLALLNDADRLEQAEGLLRAAKCPNTPRCDNQGTIYIGCELEPCQWCHERDTFLRGD